MPRSLRRSPSMRGGDGRDASPRGVRAGQLRLAVSSIAERFLSGPFLAGFAEANPDVQLDVTVTDEEIDIVAHGYDAGVRLGEVIEQDMIAVPVAGDERQMAVCAPAYRDRFGVAARIRAILPHIAASAGVRRPRPRPIAGSSPKPAGSSGSMSRPRSRPTTWRS